MTYFHRPRANTVRPPLISIEEAAAKVGIAPRQVISILANHPDGRPERALAKSMGGRKAYYPEQPLLKFLKAKLKENPDGQAIP